MIIINANNLGKVYNGENLFSGVGFSIDSKDKIGFIGINGAGKSTLFKIMTGEIIPDDGEIFKSKNLKIGYLSQHAFSDSHKTVFDEVLDVFSEQMAIEEELESITREIESGADIRMPHQHTYCLIIAL